MKMPKKQPIVVNYICPVTGYEFTGIATEANSTGIKLDVSCAGMPFLKAWHRSKSFGGGIVDAITTKPFNYIYHTNIVERLTTIVVSKLIQ